MFLFSGAKVVNISFDCSKNSEKLHANLYVPHRFYTLSYIELRRHKIKK